MTETEMERSQRLERERWESAERIISETEQARKMPLRAWITRICRDQVWIRWHKDNALQNAPLSRPELRLPMEDVIGNVEVGTEGLLEAIPGLPKTPVPFGSYHAEMYHWRFTAKPQSPRNAKPKRKAKKSPGA